MLWQFVLIVTLVWLIMLRWQNRGKRAISKVVKCNMSSLPFLGISHHFVGDDMDRMKVIQNVGRDAIEQGGLSHIWLGHRFFIINVDAVDSEYVLKNCLEKDDVLKFVRFLTGNGSIFAPVSIWRPRRKVLAPTFGLRNLNQFVTIFSRQSNILMERLEQSSHEGPFSIWKFATSYTMDSVCETTLGTQLGIQNEPNHPFLRNFETFAELTAARILQPWLHSDFVYKFTPYFTYCAKSKDFMIDFVTRIIKQKRKDIKKAQENPEEENQARIRTFLELLIESSGGDKGYTDVELQEETMVMLLAGTDTSAVGACFTTMMLSKHQDIQDKVYQELVEVLGDLKRPITAEDLPRLKYLDAVIKETLRLYPPVPITARVTDKEVVLPSGLKLEAGVGVILHIWATHRNPRYWGDDCEEFRPERFFEGAPSHPAAYQPFSYGPRNCLGYQYAAMSMKTMVATLVKKFHVIPTKNTVNEGKHLRVKFDIMMKHVDNFEVELVARK